MVLNCEFWLYFSVLEFSYICLDLSHLILMYFQNNILNYTLFDLFIIQYV